MELFAKIVNGFNLHFKHLARSKYNYEYVYTRSSYSFFDTCLKQKVALSFIENVIQFEKKKLLAVVHH